MISCQQGNRQWQTIFFEDKTFKDTDDGGMKKDELQ